MKFDPKIFNEIWPQNYNWNLTPKLSLKFNHTISIEIRPQNYDWHLTLKLPLKFDPTIIIEIWPQNLTPKLALKFDPKIGIDIWPHFGGVIKKIVENEIFIKTWRDFFRIPSGCLELHLFPSGYQLMVSESKQSSSLIPYSNRDILENVEKGQIPSALSDWLDLDKLIFRSGSVDMAIVERNQIGSVLSIRIDAVFL